jgi:glycosyltransferase involved in cell wall biosynthesis
LKNSAFVQEKNISVIPSAINHNIFNVKDLTGMPLADDISPETKKVLFVDAVGESVIKRKWLAESSVSFARQSGLQIALICPQGKSHSEVAKIMKSCDAILLTSLHEGWPNCIKEALACNLPFVSTDVSDLKEIADNEPSCFVAKTDSPEEIGMLLVKCLTCDAKRDLTKHVRDMGQEVILNRVLTTYKNLSEKVTKN